MALNKSFKRRFSNIGVLTVFAVYFLILVGGIVRSTGSGMGCPDWPKCFGSWVPPTDVSQLPEDYLEVYKEKRIEKNKKLAASLQNLGFTEISSAIFSHPSQYIETEFNVVKTWIEYVNRLVGALIGILIFITLLYSISFIKYDKPVFYLTLLSFVLVGLQGWIGSVVVSTNLLPITITIHMALALVLVAVLQYAVARASKENYTNRLTYSKQINIVLWVVAAATFLQILVGTQVREEVDLVSYMLSGTDRHLWIDKLGINFYFHRSFSIVILILHAYLAYLIYQLKDRRLIRLTNLMLILVGVEVVLGVVLAYFAIPAILQPFHLTIAALLFGVQFQMLIIYHYASRKAVSKKVVVSS